MNQAKMRFVGTWRLVSYSIKDHQGRLRFPLGEHAIGILSYDESGNMSGQLMRSTRHRHASDDLAAGTPEEMARSAKSYLAYFGKYNINEEDQSIVHVVEGSLFPNWIGTRQKRFFRFVGNMLILSAGFSNRGHENTAVLTWKRSH